MYSTFHGLEIGKRSILAQQTALSTTGHNIANANTVGYTRQDAVLQATNPLAYPSKNNGTAPMTMGTGVEVTELKRIRDGFLDQQYRKEQQKAGYWEATASALSNIESVFNEPSDFGMNSTLDRFWQSFQELAKNPDTLAVRTVVVANGKAVADSFQSITAGIEQIEKDLQTQLNGKVSDINSSAKEIADLNKQIALMTANGYQPNDLLDKRDLLLDKLSKMVNIQVATDQTGMVSVNVDGVALVNGKDSFELSVDTQTGEAAISGNQVDLEGGEIKGLVDSLIGASPNSISSLRNNLDSLAKTIAEQMNAIQAGDDARNLDDIKAGTQLEKVLFFVDKDDPTQPPKDAASMIVNPKLVDFPAKLAAATSNSIGDGSNAAAMGNLQFLKVDIGGNNTTIGDFYQMVIGNLGIGVNEAERYRDNANMVSQQVDNRRLSVSGVSIDEEMTNMVRFQQAYNAAAKYVSAVNDMLDTLINRM
ncbi:flagellar hook-associated protein FlgK [Neobacillus sp. 114]|uniref:flagellar hook-associated protein FlgK n=1 Tax=Neobacillus sp. 114 TaxID=3048535 RepID=UPI0024C4641B|nr:flagellar hook-associated protein FlgK [Neobacillus sp. 114]